MTERQKRSVVWKYFTIDPEDKYYAICKRCGVRRMRGVARNQSTSNLRRHLKNCAGPSGQLDSPPRLRKPAVALRQKKSDGLEHISVDRKDNSVAASAKTVGQKKLNVRERRTVDRMNNSVAISARTRAHKKSDVWKHFTIDRENDYFAICKRCGVRRARGIGRNRSTSSLRRHLQRCGSAAGPVRAAVPTDGNVSCSAQAPRQNQAAARSRPSQLTITQTVERKKKYENGSDRSKSVSRAIGKMMAMDLQPFSIVENDGFRQLIELLEPGYTIPSQRFFAETVIPELYAEVVRELKTDLLNYGVPGVGLLIDIWQSHQTTEYVAVTMHWASWRDNQFHKEQALVSLEALDGATSAQNMRMRLDEVVREWLPPGQVLLFCISDNVANIRQCLIDATRDLTQGWVPCIARCLDLTSKELLDESPSAVNETVSVMRTLVSKVANSQPVRRCFDKLLALHHPNEPTIELQDVDTGSWNSTLNLLEKILCHRDALEALANDNVMESFPDFQLPSAFQCWTEAFDILPKIVAALKRVDEATRMALSDSTSLSFFIPMMKGLAKQLEILDQGGEEVQGVRSLVEDMRVRWIKRMDWTVNPPAHPRDDDLSEATIFQTFLAATALDPRFKMRFAGKSPNVRQKIKEGIVAVALQLTKRENKDEPPIERTAGKDNSRSEGDIGAASRGNLSAAMMAAMNSDSDCSDEEDSGGPPVPTWTCVRMEINRELDVYLQQPLAKQDVHPMEYWSARQETFPRLAPVAAAYLACPAAIVTREKISSMTEDIVTGQRCASESPNLHRFGLIKANRQYMK